MKDTHKDNTIKKNKKFSFETKLFYFKKIIGGEMTAHGAVREIYGVTDRKILHQKESALIRWVREYERYGVKALKRKPNSNKGKARKTSNKIKLLKVARSFKDKVVIDKAFIDLLDKVNTQTKRETIYLIYKVNKSGITKKDILGYLAFSRSTYYKKPVNNRYEQNNKNKELIKSIFKKYKGAFGRKRISIYLER